MFFAILSILFFTTKVYCQNESIYIEAISQVIPEKFTTESPTLHFIVSTTQVNHEMFFDNVISELIKRININTTYRYQDINFLTKGRGKMAANIIFLSKIEDFDPFIEYCDKNYFKFKASYLFVIYEVWKIDDVEKIFKGLLHQEILGGNVLVRSDNNNSNLNMYTFFPYTPFQCGSTRPKLINIFNGKSYTKPRTFYKPKMENFHQCPLIVATFHAPPTLKLENRNGITHIKGIDGFLLNLMAGKLNFYIKPMVTEEMWGSNFGNGTMTGATGLVASKKANLTIGKFGMIKSRTEVMKASYSYYCSSVVVVIPRGRMYTDMEKLLMPFRLIVWVMLIGVLIIAFLVIIFIRKKLNREQEKFIIGSRTSSPYFNVIDSFLGQNLPQNQVAGRNFSRTLLCIFMLYGLVIRSAYTGALFKFIQADNEHHPPYQRLRDLLKNDFKFYMTRSASSFVQEIPEIFDNRLFYLKKNEQTLLRNMSDPNTKFGVVLPLDQVLYLNKMHHDEYFLNYIKLYTVNYVVYYQKHSYLRHAFDDLLLRIAQSGIYEKVETFFIQKKYGVEETNVNPAPKPLNLDQVMGCFKLLIFGMILSTIVFVIELLMSEIQEILKKF